MPFTEKQQVCVGAKCLAQGRLEYRRLFPHSNTAYIAEPLTLLLSRLGDALFFEWESHYNPTAPPLPGSL